MVRLLALRSRKVVAKLHQVVPFVAAEVAKVQSRMMLMLKRKWEVAAMPDSAASSTACFASLFATADIALEAESYSAADSVQSFAVVVVWSQIVMQMLAKSLTAQFAVL